MTSMHLHAQALKTKNVIVITIDGFRWQEVFTGADNQLLNDKAYVGNPDALKKKYWNDDPAERRKLLLPFFWSTIANQGVIAGNRLKDSYVNVKNPYWFSYPGYNEIFTGFPDPAVNSNEFGPNPNVNILEVINQSKDFAGKVAVFSSWGAFPNILNDKRSGIFVDAAFQNNPLTGLSPQFDILHTVQNQLPDVLDGSRLDAVTFNLGFEYLKIKRPRVIYFAFDETDDFAHGGRYEYYLNAAHYTDNFINELWQWVQSQDDYKDKTTLLISVDHGRGEGIFWKDHGSKIEHSSETWFAILGPDTGSTGEATSGQYYNAQYAQTIATLLGINFDNNHPKEPAITEIFKNKQHLISIQK